MPHPPAISASTAELEASLLAVLLSAGSAREGATALLAVLAPSLDDEAAALAVRDRDGLTLHVVAEAGAPQDWPSRLAPQFALGAKPGVDPGTGVLVVPLRASGRVIGALLLGDAARASSMLRDGDLASVLDTVAAVLHLFVARTEAEIRRRGEALSSVQTVLEGMAHQMANPLTGASAILQLLVEDLDNEGHRAAVRQIRQEMARAFTVLNDILDFRRDTRAHDGILDLNTIVERILRFRGYAIREQGITLEVQTTPSFAPVRAERALEHAMLIAMRFAELRSNGTVNRAIAVRVAERAGELAVEITDSSTGSIPEITPAYFDLPFRTSAESRASAEEAPDLGLVDSLLRGLGGHLEVTGAKADGTTLALVIPRAQAAATNPPSRTKD